MKLSKNFIFIVFINVLLIPTAAAKVTVFNQQLCQLSVELINKPVSKAQTVKLANNVSVNLTNAVSVKSYSAINVASNITCQELKGADYSGSSAEWKGFFDSAMQGFIKAGFKNIQLTLVGDKEKVFNSSLEKNYQVKEYTFAGSLAGNQQIIKNLALLDKANNSLYTFSVSGNVKAENDIKTEFTRLLASIKLVSLKSVK